VQHNLVVSHRSAAERSIVLTGKLGDLLNAFHADVHMFHHSSGTYRGRRGEIFIPRQFAGVITGIFGFDTRPKHKSPHHTRGVGSKGPGGTNGLAASEFAKRYNFPTAHNGLKLDGSGNASESLNSAADSTIATSRSSFRRLPSTYRTSRLFRSITQATIRHVGAQPTAK